jgi:hypothetical protein
MVQHICAAHKCESFTHLVAALVQIEQLGIAVFVFILLNSPQAKEQRY